MAFRRSRFAGRPSPSRSRRKRRHRPKNPDPGDTVTSGSSMLSENVREAIEKAQGKTESSTIPCALIGPLEQLQKGGPGDQGDMSPMGETGDLIRRHNKTCDEEGLVAMLVKRVAGTSLTQTDTYLY